MAVWYTSASIRKGAVSDQFSAVTLILRPPWINPLESIRVNGHGPAMQEAVIFSNKLSAPASSDSVAEVAFHLPSGEQGDLWSQGTFPRLTTWKVLTELPTFVWVRVLSVYLTLMFETSAGGRGFRTGALAGGGTMGTRATT